jgi:hypothetical protein
LSNARQWEVAKSPLAPYLAQLLGFELAEFAKFLLPSPAMRYFRLVASLSLLLVGCDPAPAPLARVHGKVTVNGVPLRGGIIVFAPDEKRGNRGPLSHAQIKDDGSYELKAKEGMGAAPGWHRITVAPPPDDNRLVNRLEQYRNPEMSGLTHEVKAGQDNTCDIKITLSGEW